jgi:hypothetical protein
MDERQCRLCFEHGDTAENRLFSPCECNGSLAYLHEQCLEQWRDTSWKSLWECPVCLYQYRVQRLSVYRAVMHRATPWLLTLLLTVGPVLLLASLMPASDHYHTDPVLHPFMDALWLIVGDTGMDYLVRFLFGVSLISVAVLLISAWCDCWPAHIQALFDHPTDPLRSALALLTCGGFIYLVQIVAARIGAWLKSLQRGAGDRVLEVKKRQ